MDMATLFQRRIAAASSAVLVLVSVTACSGNPQLSRDATGTHARVGTASFLVPTFLTRLVAPVTQESSMQGQTTVQGTTRSSVEGCPIALPPG